MYHDPYVADLPQAYGLSSVELTPDLVRSVDCVIIATNHASVDLAMVVEHAARVVDLRNAVRQTLGGRPDGPAPANVDVL